MTLKSLGENTNRRGPAWGCVVSFLNFAAVALVRGMSGANWDGSLPKTNKAALATELKKIVARAEFIPEPSTTVFSMLALLQSV